MTERILGPEGSKRRRRFWLVPVLVAALATVFWVTGAQAVHDIGVFQLDGDAQTAGSPQPPGEDWDLICKAHLSTNAPPGNTCVKNPNYTLPNGNTISNPNSFVVDPSESATDDILKGGTKDDNDIGTWAWTSAKPSPPKNDITDGYAAEYQCNTSTTNGNCLIPTGALNISNGDKLLYFGA